MAQITLNIPNEYVSRLTTAINSLYPKPQIPNPDYEEDPVSPSSYDYNMPLYVDEFTDVQWAKLKLRGFLANTLRRYEERRDINVAKEAVDIPEDLTS